MSDHPLTDAWWLASDGKWYPPEARHQPLPPPPFTASRRPLSDGVSPPVSHGLTGTMQGFMWAAVAISLLGSFVAFSTLSSYDSWLGGEGSLTVFSAREGNLRAIEGLQVLTSLVLFVLIIIWTRQCSIAAHRLPDYAPRLPAGMTVGSWFIPVANAVIPRMIFRDFERVLESRRSTGHLSPGRRTAIGWTWWSCLVLSSLLYFFSSILLAEESLLPESVRAAYLALIVSYLGLIISGVFGVMYVGQIARALNEAATSPSGATRVHPESKGIGLT